MVEVQEDRLTNARRMTLPERLRVLKEFHAPYAASASAWNRIFPTTAELFRIPAVRNLIDSVPNTSPFSKDTLAAIHLPTLMHWWRQDIELKLIDLICGHINREAIDRQYMFNLATSFFSCSKCSRFLRYPDVVMHACATLPFLPQDSDLDTVILTATLGETFWNLNGFITVNVAHVALLVRLLGMANLNRVTTTTQELNARDPIFECICCNDERIGRATMTWAQVVCL